jgi:hypothetical protein
LQSDFDGLPDQDFDWWNSIYGMVEDIIPKDAPLPLGNKVTTTDANLYHDMLGLEDQ